MDISGQKFDVVIQSLVYGGNGMSRLPDGRAVFIPFVLPGEKVRVQIVEAKQSFARADLLEILEPTAERITPRCKHFTHCGGCHYQHMSYENQLKVKTAILKEQFVRLAKMENLPIAEIAASPEPWNYRNTVQFHQAADGKLGFQSALSHRVIPIQECFLPIPTINQIWPQLDFQLLPGLERVELMGGVEEDTLIYLESRQEKAPEMEMDLSLSMVFEGPFGRQIMAGDDYVCMNAAGRDFKVSAGSFFQVNIPQAEAMVQYVLDSVAWDKKQVVLDLFCGVGLFSAFIAPRVGRCIGVESYARACRDFVVNLDEFDNVELYEGLVEEVLPILDVKPDVVLVDPPRAGLEKAALEALIKLDPQRIVYISCDPATLARDTRRLVENGFILNNIQPFDMFPQTYHIECVALLEKAGK